VKAVALLCLLLCLGASACKRDKGPAAQGPSASGAAQRFTAKLPEDWPSQVPTYPRGTIVTGMSLKAGDTLVQRTTDAPAKVRRPVRRSVQRGSTTPEEREADPG